MTTMISNLPRDLIEEILSRVPLKSMRAVRLTCKNWNTLSRTISESLTKMQITKSTRATREGESTIIMLMNYKLYLKSLVVDDNVDPYTEPKGKLTCLTLEHQVKISQVFLCEGLLLCILNDDTITTRLVADQNPIFSPCILRKGQYVHVQLLSRNKSSCRSHKLLRFIDYHRNYRGLHQFFWYEIYDFNSDLWTTLDVTPYWFIAISQSGVSLMGNTYWCARIRSGGYSDHIICFDFTRERFGPLLPLPFSVRDHSCVILSCVREEKLAVLFQHQMYYKYEVEIWITVKLETEMVSWSKFLRINTGPIIHTSFFIDEEKKVAIGFNDNRKQLTSLERLDTLENWILENMQSHTEPARGNNKKHQSSSETRLFDLNMLRLVAFEKAVSK
ncbi:hypothetical protein ARALYDRAFT_314297 [Arabidopsis lyrata subsp. lyrata]|uniref:F-box domain-containing protein n=1 Tax=Arabidopsis lyrata subsp. lyrata TaxID=81972 RepID=D7KD35_ARALL|nr:hypothetical protein ARALYDRAFT_314297 [Arabidopsis lyrata subsp. lyrata]